jgi:hypothetical protein
LVSWKSFSEAPDAFEALKKAFKGLVDGPVQDLLDALNNLIETVLPNFKLNWETIGWTIAWAFSVGIDIIGGFIDALSLAINWISAEINALKALEAAIEDALSLSNFDDVDRLWQKMDDNIAGLKDDWTNLKKSFTGGFDILSEGPEGFRAQWEKAFKEAQTLDFTTPVVKPGIPDFGVDLGITKGTGLEPGQTFNQTYNQQYYITVNTTGGVDAEEIMRQLKATA